MKITIDEMVVNIKTSDYDLVCNTSGDGEFVLSPKNMYDEVMQICVLNNGKKSYVKGNILFLKVKPVKKEKKK